MKGLVEFINEEVSARQLKHIEDTMAKQPKLKFSKGNIFRALNWLPDGIAHAIVLAMSVGYLNVEENGKLFPFGISRENIIEVFTKEGDFGKVEIQKAIDTCEKYDIKFKYETNKDWMGKKVRVRGEEKELLDPLS